MQVEGTSLTPKKRFRVGGITYYYRLGKLQACPSKRITLKKKIRKDENGNIIPDRTPKQRKNNTKFTFARYMFAFIRKRFGDLPVWKIAAAQRGMTDDNLIQSTNYKYLDEKGKILDMEGFQVSLGPLALPLNLRATRDGTLVTITWDDLRDEPSAAPTDRMMVGIFYADYRNTSRSKKKPGLPVETGNAKSPFAMTTVKYASTHSLHAQITQPFPRIKRSHFPTQNNPEKKCYLCTWKTRDWKHVKTIEV